MMDEEYLPDALAYDVEAAKLARRRKIAESLLRTGPVVDSMHAPTAGIGAALSRAAGQYDSAQLDDQEKLLGQRELADRQRIVGELGRTGTVNEPTLRQGQGPLLEPIIDPSRPMTKEEEKARRFGLYAEGMNVPSLRKTLEAQMGAELKQPLQEELLDTKLAGAQAVADARNKAMLEGINSRIQGAIDLKQMPTIHVTTGGGTGAGGFGGGATQLGVDDKGAPIYRHTKSGTPFQYDEQGQPVAYKGVIMPKPTADKPMNENQGNAMIYGTRAAQAQNVLDSIGVSYSPIKLDMARGAERIPGGRAAANTYMLNGNEQMVDQAQRNFINAILRRESGAVISDQEFANARKQYFPEQGDSDAVLKQKRANRELVIRGLGEVSGPQGKKAVEAEQANKPKPADLSDDDLIKKWSK